MGVREQIQRERERLRAKRKARSDKHWAEWNERAKREANARLFECRGRAEGALGSIPPPDSSALMELRRRTDEAERRLAERRARLDQMGAAYRQRKAEMRPADPPPRYDQVFEDGTRWLNEAER